MSASTWSARRDHGRLVVGSGVSDRRRIGSSAQVGRCRLAATTACAACGPGGWQKRARPSRPDDRRTPLRDIRSSVVGLIADMRNIVGEGLTASEADAILAATAVPAAERAEVLRLLEAIEEQNSGRRRSRSLGDGGNGPSHYPAPDPRTGTRCLKDAADYPDLDRSLSCRSEDRRCR